MIEAARIDGASELKIFFYNYSLLRTNNPRNLDLNNNYSFKNI